MGWTLVVQRVRFARGVHAEHKLAAGHQHRGSGQPCSTARQPRSVPQKRCSAAQIQSLQHRFVVLVFVADHHRVYEGSLVAGGIVGQHVKRVEHGRPHGLAVCARLIRRQQRQVDPTGAGMHKGVVEPPDRRRQHRGPCGISIPQQPQLFLLTDVRQVPHQGAHQRVVLPTEFRVVKLDQTQRSRPRPRQVVGNAFP
jgi:hypothetical protein